MGANVSGAAWATEQDFVSKKKVSKVGQAWWQVPVVPVTPEAEAGGLLESRNSRL
uniref:Uncharacterized protein n=1 Tax=Macaca fascicularis TaxID=9541 RepID=A0A7N9CNI2_MACFA